PRQSTPRLFRSVTWNPCATCSAAIHSIASKISALGQDPGAFLAARARSCPIRSSPISARPRAFRSLRTVLSQALSLSVSILFCSSGRGTRLFRRGGGWAGARCLPPRRVLDAELIRVCSAIVSAKRQCHRLHEPRRICADLSLEVRDAVLA